MHTQPRGFTLIEVLVALTIIAIALAAGVQTSSTLINSADRRHANRCWRRSASRMFC